MSYRPTISLYVENELVDIRMCKDFKNIALFLSAVKSAIKYNECTTLDRFYENHPENKERDIIDDLEFENRSECPIIVDISNKIIYSKDEKPTEKSGFTILDQINYPTICEYYGLKSFGDLLELIETENGLLSEWKIENSILHDLINIDETDISADEKYKINIIIDNKYIYEAFETFLDLNMYGHPGNSVKIETNERSCIYISGEMTKLFFPENLYQIPYMFFRMMEEFILYNMDISEIEKRGEEPLKELRNNLCDNKDKMLYAYKYVKWEFSGALCVKRHNSWHYEHETIEYPVHKSLSFDNYTNTLKIEDSSIQPPVFKNYDGIKIEDYMDRLKDRSETEIRVINDLKAKKSAEEALEKRFPEYYQTKEIQDLELPARELNCLLRYGLRYVGEVEELSDTDIRNIRNMSSRSPKIIRESIEELKNSYIFMNSFNDYLDIDDELL